ncbi:prephenate dehydrogenase [Atopobium sp. oral taxon 810]|uniref:prephenate dehydrogenase n=1 Tax=Atopobium sp. oral taxon 810 TaxID=712158 RepID=UPI000396F9EF|nr:prephenate dehydrogenase [Atopobium sp. oral taxon 810]ERI04776.1 prephenate dehydrogenase [Atopobium sp. oral taxon 810 str. F0209]
MPQPSRDESSALNFVPGRVGIVGLGLMGGSFAKALHEGGREVFAWNRTHSTLELAMIDTVAGELNDESIPSCELLILAGYPAAAIEWLQEKAPLISTGAIVIDTVGVKRTVCESCFPMAKKYSFAFVGCHPMAGTQYSGYAHSRASMFRGAPMVVVPPEHMDDIERVNILERLKRLLEPAGFGSWMLATAAYHDEMIAYTSQLAHVVSNAYVKSPTARHHKGFSAGSYRDLTRVARLNPGMWTELFLDNADNLSTELELLIGNLQQYKDALDKHDEQKLFDLLAEGDRLKREAESRSA